MKEAPWIVPLSDLQVDSEILAAVEQTLASKWWSMGPKVAEFEAAFADFCGAKNAVAVASGTAALHIALLAAGCGVGHEVILPSLNFVAAANVIRHVGATPVFCDIKSPLDLNLDPTDVEAKITRATRAIVVLHYGGFSCDMGAILELARRYELRVVEDAAHALGSSWEGRPCGTMGDAGCFSFFANKNLPIGEGGMIVTNDNDLAARARLLRSHGMTTLTWERHRGHAHSYDVVEHGFNYRLDEVRAAIGLVQLRRLPEWNENRARLAARYRDSLSGVEGLSLPFSESIGASTSAHHLAVVALPDTSARDAARAFLADRRIQTSVHYPPIHLFSCYSGPAETRGLARTEEAAARILTLPLFAHMSVAEIDEVTGALLAALEVVAR